MLVRLVVSPPPPPPLDPPLAPSPFFFAVRPIAHPGILLTAERLLFGLVQIEDQCPFPIPSSLLLNERPISPYILLPSDASCFMWF